MGWLTGYLYRKPIVIHGSIQGALSDYQVKLLVGYDGADGGEVDCNSHCLTTFNDLRFTNLAGDDLKYWIESITGTYLATVWIKVDNINDHAAGDGNTTIYMYYGNAGASAVGAGLAAGKATFRLFDDFVAASLDAQWTNVVGTAVIDTGNLKLTGTANSITTSTSTYAASGALTVLAKAQTPNGAGTSLFYVGQTTNTINTGADDSITVLMYYEADGKAYTTGYANTVAFTNEDWGVGSGRLNQDDRYDIYCVSGASVKVYLNGTLKTQAPGRYPNSAMYVWFNNDLAADTLLIDLVYLRNYTANEPTWGDLTKGEEYFLPHFSFYPHILAH